MQGQYLIISSRRLMHHHAILKREEIEQRIYKEQINNTTPGDFAELKDFQPINVQKNDEMKNTNTLQYKKLIKKQIKLNRWKLSAFKLLRLNRIQPESVTKRMKCKVRKLVREPAKMVNLSMMEYSWTLRNIQSYENSQKAPAPKRCERFFINI